MNEKTGTTLGWIGLIIGIIGFFFWQYWLGAAAIVLGIVGLFSPKKTLPGLALIAGIIAVIIGFTV